FFAGTPCTASCTLYGYGVTTFHPVRHINVVHVLLYNVVATEPVEIIPITHLVFHFGLLRLAWAYPNPTTIPIYLTGHNITQCAILYTFYSFAVVGLIAALKPYNDVKFLAFSLFSRDQ